MGSIRAEQSAALLRMLELNRETGSDRWQEPWKVLIYDAYCRDVIISPLLKVGDLRKAGITLHLSLDTEREVISDVPAIYFMQPTQANIRRLGDDCARQLYESFHIHFTPAVPRPLLEELAASTVESNSVSTVSRVMDQYLNFASVEEDFFSLQLPQSYLKLMRYAPASIDSVIEATIDSMVNGLFSAVVTLGAVPILRYAANGGPAQMVAEQLGRRLHDQLKAHPALFSEGQASGFQRPLLVLAERSLDFSTMIQHAWSYCALCHDLLDLRLNRVTIQETPTDGGPKKPKTYDLHASDSFWTEHMGAAFQSVASDVDRELSEYRASMEQISAGSKLDAGAGADSAALADTTRALTSTINALPELQEKKRLIDAHMNIATELLGVIRGRSIDSYYAIEEALIEGRSLSTEDKATLASLFSESGNANDRLRLLLLMHLHPGLVPPNELAQHEAALKEAGTDMRPFAALKRLMSDLAANTTSTAAKPAPPPASSTGGRVFSNVMRIADQAGVGSLAGRVGSALAAGVRQMLPSRRETPVTRAVSALMDNKGTTDEEAAYAYLDPKLSSVADGAASASRSRNAFSQAIVFVVGPGNYLEYQSLQQRAQAAPPVPGLSGRKVTYGCAEVLTAAEFVGQLGSLEGA